MKPLRCLLAAFSICLIATPTALSGQSIPALARQASVFPAPPEPTEAAAPRASASLLEVPAFGEIAEPTLLLPQARVRNRRGIPLMVAGGAAFVAGIIAGGDAGTILMLGGAGVGAWGIYVYFGG